MSKQKTSKRFRPLANPAAKVQRWSTLHAIYGRRGPLYSQVHKLIKERRNRVRELLNAGWFSGHCQGLPRLMGCRPAFVYIKGWTNLCKKRWCPFCWARQVSGFYDRIAAHHAADPCRLIERHHTRKVESAGVPMEELAYNVREQLHSRKQLMRQFNPSAAIGVIVVEPKKDYWRISARQLFADGNEYWLQRAKSPGGTNGRVTVHEDVDWDRLKSITARVLRYPSNWLTCDPAEMVKCLRAVGNARMIMSYGGYRNRNRDAA